MVEGAGIVDDFGSMSDFGGTFKTNLNIKKMNVPFKSPLGRKKWGNKIMLIYSKKATWAMAMSAKGLQHIPICQ